MKLRQQEHIEDEVFVLSKTNTETLTPLQLPCLRAGAMPLVHLIYLRIRDLHQCATSHDTEHESADFQVRQSLDLAQSAHVLKTFEGWNDVMPQVYQRLVGIMLSMIWTQNRQHYTSHIGIAWLSGHCHKRVNKEMTPKQAAELDSLQADMHMCVPPSTSTFTGALSVAEM
jgi:hypothetical protein